MIDCLLDGLLDTLKILPYLLITFLLLEYLEHKLTKQNEKLLTKAKKGGPILGGLLGGLPQCGFSSMAASLFSSRVITMGTLIAVFLSTSDEMLPVMISEKVNFLLVLKIIGFKVLVGIIIGFIIDLIYRKKTEEHEHIHDLCEDEHCDCEHGVLKSSIKHTLNISLFMLIVTFLINTIIYLYGEDKLGELFLKGNLFAPIISCLIGLIPNCGASVILTELYLSETLSLGTLVGGLLTGSGVALLLLFRVNKNLKENLSIVGIVYGIGVIVGVMINFILR